ncbi:MULTISPECIES: DUF418 domain-containing protein [unclassified Crossiella]|uniref:DUF418 domain-containing protein n=1 Tax=unclassified Crossiella TaxID=2620835 RepID=UPI001FFEBA92|nr:MULTISPECIES: DUF418 domain-containing protein [unclassified Crossiella]MCK2240605.1 DUF418 domain-containing protein [Crossiella sp. S99.2]MCK2252944.1 DUF418 domain-containing protein [Crossiella sp. S99.1]
MAENPQQEVESVTVRQREAAPSWRRHIPEGRLLGIDVLRAIAILGMIWIHFSLTGWLTAGSPATPSESIGWLNRLLDVRSREIFFLLAGVTVALTTGGVRRHRGRVLARSALRVAVRALVLFLLAFVLGELGAWDAQILHFYAMWLVLLLPFALLRARTLFVIAGVLAVAAPIFKLRQHNLRLFEPDLEQMTRLSEHGGFSLLGHPGDWLPTVQNVVFGAGSTSQDTIAVLPFLVLGLALGRLDLRDHVLRVRMVVTGAATAVGTVLVGLLAMYPFGAAAAVTAAKNAKPAEGVRAPWQELVTLAWPGPASTLFSIVEFVFMMGLITALLGGLLIAMERTLWRRLLWPFAAFGSMALTWYVVHFQLLGSGLFRNAQGYPDNRTALAFLVFLVLALVLSVLWRQWAGRGPLEWLQHWIVTNVVPARKSERRAG